MSRIGRNPVVVPAGVTASVAGQKVTVKGPKGELTFTVPEQIEVAKTADGIEVKPRPFKRLEAKVGPNEPCSCGSGKKYKKCHGKPGAAV